MIQLKLWRSRDEGGSDTRVHEGLFLLVLIHVNAMERIENDSKVPIWTIILLAGDGVSFDQSIAWRVFGRALVCYPCFIPKIIRRVSMRLAVPRWIISGGR